MAATDLDIWPFDNLVLRTPRLELRFGTIGELMALGRRAAREGIHEPGKLPFLVGWSEQDSPALERGILQRHLRTRGALTKDDWELEFVVFRDGEPIGAQGVSAESFLARRTVKSGSWLTRDVQGNGYGKEMRAAVLHLAFEGFGAGRAETGAVDWNERSIGVTRASGYRDNGDRVLDQDGKPIVEKLFAMDADDWQSAASRRIPVDLSGAEPVRRFLEIDTPGVELS